VPRKTNNLQLNVNVMYSYVANEPLLVVHFCENFIIIAESPRSALSCLGQFFLFDFDYCLVIFLGNCWSEYFVILKFNVTFSCKILPSEIHCTVKRVFKNRIKWNFEDVVQKMRSVFSSDVINVNVRYFCAK